FLAHSREIARAAFERAMPTIYIGKGNTSTGLLSIPRPSHVIPRTWIDNTARCSTRAFADRNDVAALLQGIQIVCPLLHHCASFRQVRGAVVRATIRVAYRMRELVFDIVGTDVQ